MSKMSYIPPHKRQNKCAEKQQTKWVEKRQNKCAEKRLFKNEFPQLATPKPVQETGMDFKKLFKNVETKRKKREQRIKKGWVKLTKEGMVDSLTIEERKEDDDYNESLRKQYNLNRLVNTWDKHRQMRLDRDGYLSDYSVEPPSQEEAEDEEYEEQEEDYFESEEEDLEPLGESKWFTS